MPKIDPTHETWVVEADGATTEFDTASTANGDAEGQAKLFQYGLRDKGVDSQLYRRRWVFTKESVRWLPGTKQRR